MTYKTARLHIKVFNSENMPMFEKYPPLTNLILPYRFYRCVTDHIPTEMAQNTWSLDIYRNNREICIESRQF